MKTIYLLNFNHKKYISTDVTEMTAFELTLGCLGSKTEAGETTIDIPLIRIDGNLKLKPILQTRFECSRCKWFGAESELKDESSEHLPDFHVCPKCGEHKLNEI